MEYRQKKGIFNAWYRKGYFKIKEKKNFEMSVFTYDIKYSDELKKSLDENNMRLVKMGLPG